MTIEATLTREVGITFIDARKFVTQAKLEMGIKGYPNKDQQDELIEIAKKAFHSQPEEAQKAMQVKRAGLESAKVLTSSHHSINFSNHTASTDPADVSDDFSVCEDSIEESSINSKGNGTKRRSTIKKIIPGLRKLSNRSSSNRSLRRNGSFSDASLGSSSSGGASTIRRSTSVAVCSSLDARSYHNRRSSKKASFTRPPKPASFSSKVDLDNMLLRGIGSTKKNSPSSQLNCTW